MRNYEKPIVLANNELSEGVFAASGAVQPQSNFSYSFTQNGNSWTDNGKTKGNYNIKVVNTGSEPVKEITVTVPITGDITSIGGNVKGVNNGDGTATITFTAYNEVPPGGTAEMYMSVEGNGSYSFGN